VGVKPIIHGRDHCPGGADPIPCLTNILTPGRPYREAVFAPSDLIAWWRMGEEIDFSSLTYVGPPSWGAADHTDDSLRMAANVLEDSSGNGHWLNYIEDATNYVRGTPNVPNPAMLGDDDGAYQSGARDVSKTPGLFGSTDLTYIETLFGRDLRTVAFFLKTAPGVPATDWSSTPLIGHWGNRNGWQIDLGMNGWIGGEFAGTQGVLTFRTQADQGGPFVYDFIYGPAVVPETWYHVAVTWDGENQDNFDIYVKTGGSSAPLRLNR
jgi:hypothetical protein